MHGTLVLQGGRIKAVERGSVTGAALDGLQILAPGLIDLHVHGFAGCDPLRGIVDGVGEFRAEGGAALVSDGGLAGMASALARAGTTAFQPTLFPAEPTRLGANAAACWRRAGELDAGGGHARVLGLHLEGPFVNPLAAGALPPADLAEPSVAALAALLGPATGGGRGIRTVTIAPELPGSAELIAELTRAGVRASLGHSRASAAEGRAALRGGAGAPEQPFGVTHLFNAMTGVHHRDPGLATLALTDEALVVELIGDLVHVGPEAIDLALRARGAAGLALVSDALEGAGTGCDVFHSHGRAHRCHSGAAWYPADRGETEDTARAPRPERLAGSATGQLEAVQRLVARGVVSAADGLTMASLAPARALGMEHELGVLAPGARADLIELDPKGLGLRRVLLGGSPLPGGVAG